MTDETDWTKLAGLVCTCPPNCTGTRWGNGPARCDTACRPCAIMAGTTYTKPPKAKKAKAAIEGERSQADDLAAHEAAVGRSVTWSNVATSAGQSPNSA